MQEIYRPNKLYLGKKIEEFAAKYLINHHLQILEKNFRCKFGEIDLICRDNIEDTIIFVEVRYRRSRSFGEAADSINHAKRNKLINTANYYLITKYFDYAINYRFDIITVQGPLEKMQIDWFKNELLQE